MKYLNVVGACVSALCARMDTLANPAAMAWNLDLALTEATSNIIRHAYQGQANHVIHFVFTLAVDRIVIDIFDYGESFQWDEISKPDLSEPHEGGYGLFMIGALMDEFSYHAKGTDMTELRPDLIDYIRPQEANHHRLVKWMTSVAVSREKRNESIHSFRC